MHEVVLVYENCPDIRSVWHLHVFVPIAVWALQLLLGYLKHDNFTYYSTPPLWGYILAVHFYLIQFDMMSCCSHVVYRLNPWFLHIILFAVMWLLLVYKEWLVACDEADLMKLAPTNTDRAMLNCVKNELAELTEQIRAAHIRLHNLVNAS